jgi:hypothetical protein
MKNWFNTTWRPAIPTRLGDIRPWTILTRQSFNYLEDPAATLLCVFGLGLLVG